MRTFSFRLHACLCTGLCLMLFYFPAHLWAQSASVSGQIVDASGAVVPGAAVTMVRPSTGVQIGTTSDGRGVFVLPPVAPGVYSVSVRAPGFTTWLQSDINLETGEKEVLKPVLIIGSVGQTVTVNASTPELKTQDSDRITVTEASLVSNIPLDVRNPLQETNFTPE